MFGFFAIGWTIFGLILIIGSIFLIAVKLLN